MINRIPLSWTTAAAVFFFLLTACGSGSTPAPTPANLTLVEYQGYDLFNLHCAPCHATSPGTVIVGPSLAGIATTAGTRVEGQSTDAYLRASMLKPNDFVVEGFPESMPPDFGKRLTGDEFDAIIAYLLTLK